MTSDEMRLHAIEALADFEAEAAVESRSKLIDQHHSAFRWIIASLFALNGGAILSIFGKGELGIGSTYLAFWVFFGGIVATFLTVVTAQISDRLMIARMHGWGLYWKVVGVTGIRDEEQESQIKAGISSAEKWGRFARLLALFAMIWFVLGVLTAAVSKQKSEIERLQTRLDQLEVKPASQ